MMKYIFFIVFQLIAFYAFAETKPAELRDVVNPLPGVMYGGVCRLTNDPLLIGLCASYDSRFDTFSEQRCINSQNPTGDYFTLGSDCNTPYIPGGYYCDTAQGWTLSGEMCTRPECPSGEFRDFSGVCQKDCTGKQGQKTASYGYGINGGGHNTTVAGCQVHCTESVCYGLECSIGDCKYTGKPGSQPGDGTYVGPEQKPDPTKNPPAKPSDCGVKGQGYIQGSTGTITCVPYSDAPAQPAVSSEKSAESGKTGSDGKPDPSSPDYKKSDSTSKSSGSETSTTTKTTENPDTSKNGTTNGGCPAGAALVDGKCVTTTTTKESTSDFCTKNPNATACKAVKDACVDNPSLISCAKAGEPESVPDPEKTEKSLSSVSIVPIGSGGAYCPADVTVRGATFTYSKLCEGLNTVKPVVIALAWIAAAFIMFGSVKGS